MLNNFKGFLNEELKIEDMDKDSLEALKNNLQFRLNEYRTFILSNIYYNFETNELEFKDFDSVDIVVIMRELTNEFTQEAVKELNLESFLRKINQILELKNRNTKRKVRNAFDDYYKSIEI